MSAPAPSAAPGRLGPPRVVVAEVQAAAVVGIVTPRAEMRSAMTLAIRELRAALGAQDLAASGPMFAHHTRLHPDVFALELGLPVQRPVRPAGRVRPGMQPGGPAARALYEGDYAGLAAGWAALLAWIAEQGHAAAPGLWEVYVAGPETDPDPASWRTELNQKLLG